MVRWMLPMLCVACAAGAPGTDAPPTCGEAECAPACAEADAKVVVPAGGDRLTAYEAERLTGDRMALRRGLGPRGNWPLLWCAGSSTCEQALDPLKTTDLPAGSYVVALPLRVPSAGTWQVVVDVDCDDGGPPDQHVSLLLSATSGVGTGPFVPVTVPAGWAGRCSATVSGPDGRMLGSATAPFSLSPQPLVVLTAAQLAVEPPVATAPEVVPPPVPVDPAASPPAEPAATPAPAAHPAPAAPAAPVTPPTGSPSP